MAINYGPTSPENPFGDILDVLGPMTEVSPVTEEEAERYRGRLPDGLLRFWLQHGRGALLGGYAWLCDPALMRPVLDAVFAGDPEFKAEDIDIYLYSHDGRLSGWSPRHNTVVIEIAGFEATCVVHGTSEGMFSVTGERMSPDLAVGHDIRSQLYVLDHDRDTQSDYFTSALERLGPLAPGEIYGYFPSMRIGGSGEADTMRKVKLVEHLLFLAQLGPTTLVRYVRDFSDPARPYGRREAIRVLGPQN